MAYDTTEAVAKFLSGFQMKITNREKTTIARISAVTAPSTS